MLVILFKLGDRRYGLDSQCVVEIFPVIPLRELPGAPPAVKGLCQCRGRIVPVIDLCQLTIGRPADALLSSRYLLVNADESGQQQIALLAEHVTDTMTVDDAALHDSGLRLPDAPHLGKIIKDDAGELIQCVDVSELITPEIRKLFKHGEVALS